MYHQSFQKNVLDLEAWEYVARIGFLLLAFYGTYLFAIDKKNRTLKYVLLLSLVWGMDAVIHILVRNRTDEAPILKEPGDDSLR